MSRLLSCLILKFCCVTVYLYCNAWKLLAINSDWWLYATLFFYFWTKHYFLFAWLCFL